MEITLNFIYHNKHSEKVVLDTEKDVQRCYECGKWGQDYEKVTEIFWSPEEGDREEQVFACSECETDVDSEPTIDMTQQAEQLVSDEGEIGLGIVDSEGTKYVIRAKTEEEKKEGISSD